MWLSKDCAHDLTHPSPNSSSLTPSFHTTHWPLLLLVVAIYVITYWGEGGGLLQLVVTPTGTMPTWMNRITKYYLLGGEGGTTKVTLMFSFYISMETPTFVNLLNAWIHIQYMYVGMQVCRRGLWLSASMLGHCDVQVLAKKQKYYIQWPRLTNTIINLVSIVIIIQYCAHDMIFLFPSFLGLIPSFHTTLSLDASI